MFSPRELKEGKRKTLKIFPQLNTNVQMCRESRPICFQPNFQHSFNTIPTMMSFIPFVTSLQCHLCEQETTPTTHLVIYSKVDIRGELWVQSCGGVCYTHPTIYSGCLSTCTPQKQNYGAQGTVTASPFAVNGERHDLFHGCV